MKIVFLNDDALPTGRGGTAVVVHRLREAYAKKGHEVFLVTTHQENDGDKVQKRSDEFGEIYSIYRTINKYKRHKTCLFDQEMHDTLKKLFAEIKPDAVHAHNLHTYLTYDALNVAKEFTDQVVLTAHDVFLVAFNRVNSKRYFSSVLKGTPYKMYWYENLFSAGRRYYLFRNSRIRKILRESGTKVVASSNALKNFLEVNKIPVHAVIQNGASEHAPLDRELKNRYGLTDKVILFGGRISKDKGTPELLKAFEEVRKTTPAQLLIVGNVEQTELTPLVSNIDTLQNIVCTGWVDYNATQSLLMIADVVTTPSMCLDVFPSMNVEAMMAEKPVVGTCFGGTPEIVKDEETGFVIDPRETHIFASALTKILTSDSLAQSMGAAGRKRAEEKFSMEKQADGYLKLLAN